MNFIFKYAWYAKILLMSYIITLVNRVSRLICPVFMISEILCPNVGKVEVNDIEYEIVKVYTSNFDITKRFRLYCYLNDIIYLEEVKLMFGKVIVPGDVLRILIRNIEEDNLKQVEIDVDGKYYITNTRKRISQDQIIFDF